MSKAGKTPSVRLIGRGEELQRIRACIRSGRNVLLEGPVGVGKTHLALAAVQQLKRPVFRVDGDGRFSEQKLSGWFDPPTAMKKGFVPAAFMPGPLVEAMQAGGVLFINELNRLPEGVQNVLLPAIDEKIIHVPRLGNIRARDGFVVVATQNPKEFVATSHLSEAILDRFELVTMDYQPENEELEIVAARLKQLFGRSFDPSLPLCAVRLARLTRQHPQVRRGASIRAALSTGELTAAFVADGKPFATAFVSAAVMALPTRIEVEREAEGVENDGPSLTVEALVREGAEAVLNDIRAGDSEKKKN